MVWIRKSKGGKEGCALIMFTKVWKIVKAHGWKGSRIVCVVRKTGIGKYA